ncbi:unnamed protein product [Sphagnum troendelagicum]|uniref:Nitronate monooxygenase domain-containing protein n=1 Tax=Sphagnum troendelagicum TaxID=128251 RepID=A0ABP0T9P0_9BRYO
MGGWGGFLGVENGVVLAPMGPDISGPDLVAAVANAGGLGFLRAPPQDRVDLLRRMIARTRELTNKPFGVGIILAFPDEPILQAVLEEKVAFLHVSWGDFPKRKVDEAHRAGVRVVHQVGSVEDAIKAAVAGVDAIIAQGIEAGGHIMHQMGLMTLLPSVVDAVKSFKIPVIAAGGIVDARGYVACLALGAQGICMGTRFLATLESYAHPLYKQKILEASSGDTEYTNLYGRARWPGAHHRTLRTPFFETWKNELAANENELNQPIIGQTTIFEREEDVPLFSGKVPNLTTTGEVENMAMYAGTGVGQINEILPAAIVLRSIVEEAEAIIEHRLRGLVESQDSKVSHLHTMV